jgi:hypothetical protein
VSGAWAGSNSTDAGGWKRVNVSGLGGGRVGGGAARGKRGASDGGRAGGGAVRSGAASGDAARGGRACGEGRRAAGDRQIGFKSSDRGIYGRFIFVGLTEADKNSGYFRGPADENIAVHENNHYFRRSRDRRK